MKEIKKQYIYIAQAMYETPIPNLLRCCDIEHAMEFRGYCDVLWAHCYGIIQKKDTIFNDSFFLNKESKQFINTLVSNSKYTDSDRNELLLFYRLAILTEQVLFSLHN